MRIDVETTAMPLTADVERHQSAARSATQIFIHGRDHITNIQIKSAGIEDAPIVALLGRLAFSETFGHLFTRHTGDLAGYLADTFGLAKIRGSLGQSENQYWLALADGLPIGYAKLKYPSEMPQLPKPKVAQLQKIYVLRDFLGQGVGSPLLQAACDCAAALEVDTVWLTVLAENKRAIRFYQRHGFAVLTQTTFSIGAQTFDFDVLRKDIGIMSLSGVHGAVSR
ncbi:MAG TPA: GNAT family N-acetyltransferase [Castellaniella sp.]|jgi:ribosomal protein S18 acetylase RimI-like enzyme|nr:GNAT family N-acetyltransferase [Castellaniella sp.]